MRKFLLVILAGALASAGASELARATYFRPSSNTASYVALQSGTPVQQDGNVSISGDIIEAEGLAISLGNGGFCDAANFNACWLPQAGAASLSSNVGDMAITANGGALILNGGDGVQLGLVSQLGNLVTSGQGVVSIHGGYISASDETAGHGDSALFAVGTGSGFYKVSAYAISNGSCATPGPAGINIGLKWTDPTTVQKSISAMPMVVNGSATLATSLPLGNSTGWATGQLSVYVNASTSIIFNITLTACTSGTAKYRAFLTLNRIL